MKVEYLNRYEVRKIVLDYLHGVGEVTKLQARQACCFNGYKYKDIIADPLTEAELRRYGYKWE